ncbi:MAG: DUF1858 domain-containing protein [Magnetococcales bacterium]|nr:DUF1858 domain-containing protein [Magnetococcales bacterium]MBF0582939.1 DUF1858 domain-containing protein [Magnetococcales bacterium]
MNKIDPTKSMTQLIHEYPHLAHILWQQGIECAECMASQVDTLLDVARMYKLDINHLIEQVYAMGKSTDIKISPDHESPLL